MKRLFSYSLAAMMGCASASAALSYTYTSGFENGGAIPDGDLTGWHDTRTISDIAAGQTLADLNVTLSLSGGHNGDLYGYLQHDSGFVVLLNRPGKTAADPSGYDNPGLVVTFDDAAGNQDIHLYQTFNPSYNGNGQLLGTWQSDGRNVHPSTVLNTDPRTATLGSFNTLNPNGDWTLFLADVSFGDQSTVVSWGLEITAVPEVSSLIPALLVLGGAAWRHRRRAQKRG
ncbi:MAG: PEP-CTERM sorting domain-containing protein [Verrucomicrobia bacterium]|nr:PEP-CTERM sorting domain-containing protein [Verrucomicrobiota bacterium]